MASWLNTKSWLNRPRRPFVEAIPSWRAVQAAWAFPFICLGVVTTWLFGGPKPVGLPLLVLFSALAPAETIFILMWLRRPVKRSND